ncbi:MAG: hypothetical protein LKF56_05730 [Prevotella sp.]|jgi:tetratricopeptide (TPR) repeat protein|nr:hypothetical protein [Prevotella sp.]MCH4216238.1 hypothetical protein [Prevotella sp.]MCH4251559.1 hypothetical protein [Prevotella sp.]MCI1371724.1 hypothetical protein [Prevotella sp.]
MKYRLFVVVAAMLMVGATLQASPRRNEKVVPTAVSRLSRNDQLRFEYFYVEAARQQSAGHYDAAFDLLQHALSIDPDASEVYFGLSSYYSAMKNDSVGLICLEKAAKLNPANTTYMERLGEYYIGTQNYDRAIRTYEDLWSHDHDNTDALSILSQLYQQQKDYRKELDVIRRLELEEGTSERLTLAKMSVYDQMNDKKQAYKELKSLVTHHPNDVNYKTMLGNWLMQNNRTKEAYGLFMDVLKDEPNNNMAQTSLYDYYNTTHQEAQAQVYLNRLLMNKDTPAETKGLLMRAYIQKNEQEGGDSTKVLALMDSVLAYPQKDATIAQLKAAYMSIKKMPEAQVTKAFMKVLEIAPDDASARLQVIQSLWNRKDYDGVIALCKPAREYNPDEMAFYYFDGLAHYQKKDDDAALDDFRRGVSQINSQSNPDMVSDFYAIMGDILNAKGQYKEAYAAYDSCLQWKPDNVPCLNNYAYYLSLRKINLKKAEEMSYKTVKAEPKNATYLDTYAYILFVEKRYSEAKIYIDQAMANMDSTSTSEVIPEHAGDIYALSGNMDKAEMYWKQSLKMGNKSKCLQRKIKLRKYIKDTDEKNTIH